MKTSHYVLKVRLTLCGGWFCRHVASRGKIWGLIWSCIVHVTPHYKTFLSTKLKRILFDLAALLKNVLILSPKIKFMHIPILMWTMSHKQLSSRNKSERRIMRLFCAEITHCAHDAHTACMPCEALPCLYSQFPYADLENSQVKNFCLLPPPSLKQGKALNALIQLSVLHM